MQAWIFGLGNLVDEGLFRGVIQGANQAELRDLTVQVFTATGRQHLVGMLNPRVHDRQLPGGEHGRRRVGVDEAGGC